MSESIELIRSRRNAGGEGLERDFGLSLRKNYSQVKLRMSLPWLFFPVYLRRKIWESEAFAWGKGEERVTQLSFKSLSPCSVSFHELFVLAFDTSEIKDLGCSYPI